LLDLECDEIMKDNSKFGPKFIGKSNYELYIVKCPNNCYSSD